MWSQLQVYDGERRPFCQDEEGVMMFSCVSTFERTTCTYHCTYKVSFKAKMLLDKSFKHSLDKILEWSLKRPTCPPRIAFITTQGSNYFFSF